MTTPEGLVKNKISKLLLSYGIYPAAKAGATPVEARGWVYMPHQAGLGVRGIPDFIGHYNGRFFAIEAKTRGKKPTGFQHLQILAILMTGGACFVVDGDEALEAVERWLNSPA